MAKEKIQYMNLLSEAIKKWEKVPPEAKEMGVAKTIASVRGFDLLWRVVERIEEKHHINVKDIVQEERWKQAFAVGQGLAKKYKEHGIKDLYNAFFSQYEGSETPSRHIWFELNDERDHHWVLHCPNLQHFRNLGRTDEEIKEMAPYFCLQDVALVKGFNSKFEVSQPVTIMMGDDHCTYIVDDHGGKAEPIPESGVRSPEEIP